MAADTDPYRTLGLTRDATLDEVRRAYRRLAKANHPDAAGEAALPRFLAIQAAYDTIAGPDAGTRPSGAARSSGARRPWDPDRDRAEATYRAYGGRPRRARPAGPSGSARSTAGERPSGERPTGARPSGERPGAERPPGSAGPRPSRPERPPNKATLGSTSYDGAEAEPFEPDWGGASWYGTTSGTYWTLNPKEYADPRKHGPEYQARARRQLGGWEEGDGPDPAEPPSPPGSTAAADAGSPDRDATGPRAEGPRPATHTTSSWWEATAGDTPRSEGSASRRARSGRATGAAHAASAPRADEPARSPGDAARRADRGATAGHEPAPSAAGRLGRDAALTADGLLEAVRAWLDDDRPGAIGRIGRAIVGWAPIALAIGWTGGEMSGCGRFAAGCDDGLVMGAWLVQVAALVTLVVIGRLARIASVATLATLTAAIPAALLLSATGSPEDTAAGRFALSGLLVIAWLVGLVFGAVRELRGTALRHPGPPGIGGPGRPVS